MVGEGGGTWSSASAAESSAKQRPTYSFTTLSVRFLLVASVCSTSSGDSSLPRSMCTSASLTCVWVVTLRLRQARRSLRASWSALGRVCVCVGVCALATHLAAAVVLSAAQESQHVHPQLRHITSHHNTPHSRVDSQRGGVGVCDGSGSVESTERGPCEGMFWWLLSSSNVL